MAWITPKMDWTNGDTISSTDLNRIEGNIDYLYADRLTIAIADGRYLKLTGGTLTGNLLFSVNAGAKVIQISGSASNAFIKKTTNQGGLCIGADSSLVLHAGDNTDTLLSDMGITSSSTVEDVFIVSDNNIFLRTNYQSTWASTNVFTFSSAGNFTVPGNINATGGVINNLTCLKLFVKKNVNSSIIEFEKQTNDPGYIEHYENNNASRMMFSVSDDSSDDDYFAFGHSLNGFQSRFRINANGNTSISGTLGVSGSIGANGGLILTSSKSNKIRTTSNGDWDIATGWWSTSAPSGGAPAGAIWIQY